MKSNDNYLSLQPPPNIGNWYAFLLWSFSMRIADTDKPVGSLLARIRHLKILGYKPLLVSDNYYYIIFLNLFLRKINFGD